MNKSDDPHLVSRSTTTVSPFRTGSWRQITPEYRERISPCTDLCPCFGSIPKWLDLARKGDFAEAWRTMIVENPFPLITGRVCYRFCEAKCNRGAIDDKVSIGAVERFLGEYAVTKGLSPEIPITKEAAGVRVAVLGGGPGGLAAAHMLARKGADVTIYDENAELGGMLRYGIPEYRLPKELLQKELRTMIEGFGVKTELSTEINPLFFKTIALMNDYVVIAVGAHKQKELLAEKGTVQKAYGGLDLLKLIARGKLKELPKEIRNVLVVGGGNTAIDVSRSLIRLGAEVTIVYRRSEELMPAHKDEIAAAKKEGVNFLFTTMPTNVASVGGHTRLTSVKTELREVDGGGRKRPFPIGGSEFTLDCDLLISAIGEEASFAFTSGRELRFASEYEIHSGSILMCGDALNGPHSVSEAIASGKKTAATIIARITGKAPQKRPEGGVTAEEINFSYLRSVRKDPRILGEKELSWEELRTFAEATSTMSEDMARREADRCINCGTCIACDRCLSFCPDFAITRSQDGAYAINYDMCKGCGICAEVCERGVIIYEKREST